MDNQPRQMHIVIGANYGDEGKGQVTANLFKQSPIKSRRLNVLTNGGSQRGHTVVDVFNALGKSQRISHTHHHFGSGTLYGAANYYSSTFIVNPMDFVKEWFELKELGVDMESLKIYCDSRVRWATPYDMVVNRALEDERGSQRHGSVGSGIWETVQRYKYDKWPTLLEYHKLQSDFINKEEIIKRIKRYQLDNWHHLGLSIKSPHYELLRYEELTDHYISDCNFFCRHVEFIDDFSKVLRNYDFIVFENGQGLMLNQDRNNVNTTPSDTGWGDSHFLLFIADLSEDPISVHYVTRPYVTRHGAGVLYNEQDREKLSELIKPDLTNLTSKYQGSLRYAPLNVKDLLDRVDANFRSCKMVMPKAKMVIDVTHHDEAPDFHIQDAIYHSFSEDDIPVNSMKEVDER